MCGIIGYVGSNGGSVRVLIDGLERLEYRGYDSAGIAFINDNCIEVIKKEGKIASLREDVNFDVKSNLGIGHTRWATHGKATSSNAHPHRIGKITIVHNGIVENYDKLKADLKNKGYEFKSETDSEVVAALIDYVYKTEKDMLKTIRKVKEMLVGSYALGIICDDEKDTLYAVKNKSPLIIGVNDGENYIASDVPAILDKTKKHIVLEDGCYAKITNENVKLYKDGKEKDVKGIQLNPNVASVHGHIFPVYVQNKGYQYYGFNGKEAIKTIYKDAQDFDQYGVAVVSKDGEKYYLMNSKGEKQSKNYVKIESIEEGYYAAYETNSKYEIINTKGKIDIHDYFMGESQVFEFDGKVYALLNKSGTTYLYDMEKGESVFSLEGEYQLYNGKYLRKKNHKAYYDLEGNLIYKG